MPRSTQAVEEVEEEEEEEEKGCSSHYSKLRIPSSVRQATWLRHRRSRTRRALEAVLGRLRVMENKVRLQSERHDQLLSSLQECGCGQGGGIGTATATASASMDTQICGTQEEEEADEQTSGQGWQTFMDSVRCRLNVNQVVRQVRTDATLTLDFLVLLVAAALISCVGLVGNSFLLLSSSMLISPLMGPINAGTFGSVIGDRNLWWLGIKNELIGIAVALGIGFIFGVLVFRLGPFFAIGSGLTEEIVSRCTIHALAIGILTALVSGAAGAIAVLGSNTGSLAGVAISASLLPPAVNSGLLFALALGTRVLHRDHALIQSLGKHHEYSKNLETELLVCALVSMALALVNVVCIWVTGVIVLLIKEVTPAVQRNQQFWRHDIRTARKASHREPALQEAIKRWDEQSQSQMEIDMDAPHYQHTWSPGMDRLPIGEHLQRNYHTVHGFQELCFTLQKLKQDQAGASSAAPTVMELFANIKHDHNKGKESAAPRAYCSETDLPGRMAVAAEQPSTSHGHGHRHGHFHGCRRWHGRGHGRGHGLEICPPNRPLQLLPTGRAPMEEGMHESEA